jgi:hypothetical protein
MREIAEGTRDEDGFLGGQRTQDGVEPATPLKICIALESDAETADVLNLREYYLVFLLADGLSEDLP